MLLQLSCSIFVFLDVLLNETFAGSPKLWGRVGALFPGTKHGVSRTLPRTFLAKQMYRLGRLELLAVT